MRFIMKLAEALEDTNKKRIIASIRHYTFMSSINLGLGLGYATQTEKYHHYPLVVLFPSTYLGYHIFKNGNEIVNWWLKKM